MHHSYSKKLVSALMSNDVEYGNTGYGVVKEVIQNWTGFWLKINCSQMKLPNFGNWMNGELSTLGIILENKIISKLMLSKKCQ
jgi:hypothetical protein